MRVYWAAQAEADASKRAASVRPQYACRLAGTLADVIARGEREAAARGRPSGQDRRGEIVDLLRYAFEARPIGSHRLGLCAHSDIAACCCGLTSSFQAARRTPRQTLYVAAFTVITLLAFMHA